MSVRRGTVLPFLTLLAASALLACTPKYPKCDKDSHCEKQGEVCVEGTCQQCRGDDQCGATDKCEGGRCVPKAECAQDGDCKGGKVCRSGKCANECEAKSDCGSGLKCKSNRCVDEMACDGPADCASGLVCRNGRCSENTDASRGMSDCSMQNVNFEYNQSRLTKSARDSLSSIAECLKSKGGDVTIEGHCDERGTEEYNLALGEARAKSVEKYLTSLGVPRGKLRVISKGELEPLDSAQTESAFAKNRRAQFIER